MTRDQLLCFSADRQLYRAYDHALVASDGMLIAVLLTQLDGRIDDIVDACPIPWQEVLAVLAADVEQPLALPSPDVRIQAREVLRTIEAVSPSDLFGHTWLMGFLPKFKAVVFDNCQGVRVAMAAAHALHLNHYEERSI